MTENVFIADTAKEQPKVFNKKVKLLLSFAIILNVIFCISTLAGLVPYVTMKKEAVGYTGACLDVWQMIVFISALSLLISLIKIRVSGKVFEKVVIYCVRTVGILFVAASVVLTHLSGYQSSGAEIFSRGDSVFMDGMILFPGLVFLLFASLLNEGAKIQKEYDEIL